MTSNEVNYELAAAVEMDGDIIRGIASTIGNVDRSRRAFLPGAFGKSSKRVPLLAYHDDTRPVGSSTLTPNGMRLDHESMMAKTAFAQEMRELVRAGAIPATSIGWVSEKQYIGDGSGEWNEAGVRYFEDAEIVENSLVPIPANPFALISPAAMLQGVVERAHIERMIEIAAGGGPDAQGYVMRNGKRVYDPDNDGDDDSTPSGDTDHDYWDENGNLTPKGQKTNGPWKKATDGGYEVAAPMSSADQNDLPDSAFAYIEPGGIKDASGRTTPRSLRHFPVQDEAHARNALARAPQSPFGKKAMPKILAACRKFGIKVSDNSSFDEVMLAIAEFEYQSAGF